MKGIDNRWYKDSRPLSSWPAKGFVSEFNSFNYRITVEVTRGKHKDPISNLMSVNVMVTERVWYDDATLDNVEYYCWQIEQYDAYIKKCQEEEQKAERFDSD